MHYCTYNYSAIQALSAFLVHFYCIGHFRCINFLPVFPIIQDKIVPALVAARLSLKWAFANVMHWLIFILVNILLYHHVTCLDVTEDRSDMDNTKAVYQKIQDWWSKMSNKRPIKCHMNYPAYFQKNQVGKLLVLLPVLVTQFHRK